MLRIACYPCDFGGCGAYRFFIPAIAMRRWPERFEHRWDLRADDDDIVALQRPSDPNLAAYIENDLKRHPHVRFTADVDDWMFGFQQLVRQGVARNLVGNLSHVHRVSVSTPALAELYGSRLSAPVEVIPNYLHWPMWERLPPRSWDRLRIGWMGLVRSHRHDLRELRGVLGPWLARHPDVEFVWAGRVKDESEALVHDLLEVPEAQRVTLPAVEFGRIPLITSRMDVGLVPLVQGKVNDAKSALKGMEYAACGIPCVASATAEYRGWVEPGVNGFVARRARDWPAALDRLYEDRELLRRMGEAARQKAWEYRIDAHVEEWASFYEGAA